MEHIKYKINEVVFHRYNAVTIRGYYYKKTFFGLGDDKLMCIVSSAKKSNMYNVWQSKLESWEEKYGKTKV